MFSAVCCCFQSLAAEVLTAKINFPAGTMRFVSLNLISGRQILEESYETAPGHFSDLVQMPACNSLKTQSVAEGILSITICDTSHSAIRVLIKGCDRVFKPSFSPCTNQNQQMTLAALWFDEIERTTANKLRFSCDRRIYVVCEVDLHPRRRTGQCAKASHISHSECRPRTKRNDYTDGQ